MRIKPNLSGAHWLVGVIAVGAVSACGAEPAPSVGEQSEIAPRDSLAAGEPSAEEAAPVEEQIRQISVEKQSWTPEQQKLSPHLLFAAKELRGEAYPKLGPSPVDTVGVVGGQVLVDIKATVSDELLDEIRTLGGSVLVSVPNFDGIRARMPVDKLEELASDSRVRAIDPAWGAVTNVTSNGDVAHRANVVRAATGYDGTGIKIGVLSDGVASLAALQAAGELPTVTVLPGQAGSGSEGTAMLEIVHDLAPGAELYFATAFNGEASFAQNILDLRAAGCDIIVDDVFYFAEGAFQDDIIARAVNTVVDDGALYFSSAGNSGSLFSEPQDNGSATFDSGMYEADYNPGTVPAPVLSFEPATVDAHRFGPGAADTLLKITQDTTSYFTLEWSDPLGASANDYDLYVLNAAGTALIGGSIGAQNGTQDPFEIVNSTSANHLNANLVVARYGGAGTPAPRFIRVNANRGRFLVGTNGQTSGHSAAVGAFSVAAVGGPWALGVPTPPVVFSAATTIEAFSSDGPRRVFFDPFGAPLSGGFLDADAVVRPKPDISAADGVATATPGFNPFFGTSAAAPHAAALAALVMQANPYMKTLGNANATAAMRAAFAGETIDIHDPGFDEVSGSGIVMADSAQPFDFCTNLTLTANPSSPAPEATDITLSATSVGCANPRYRFRYRAKGGSWTNITGFGPADEVVFSTAGLAPGKYTLEVSARQLGLTTIQSKTQIPFTLQDTCDSVTLDVTPTGSQPVGTELTASAVTDGCASPLYKFDYRLKGASWVSLGGYSASSSVPLDTSALAAGKYQFRVRVRGKGTSGVQAKEIVPFTLVP